MPHHGKSVQKGLSGDVVKSPDICLTRILFHVRERCCGDDNIIQNPPQVAAKLSFEFF